MEKAIGAPRREGFGTVTPYLMVDSVHAFVSFLQKAFGARETFRSVGSAGGLHCEVQIGDSRIMMGESNSNNAAPAMLFLYVADTDAVYQAALAAGAKGMMEPADGRFEEKRGAGIGDPFGNTWFIATHDDPGSRAS